MQGFFSVILCLSGNKREPRCSQVIEILQKSEVQNSESDYLSELIAYMANIIDPLCRQQLNDREIKIVNAVLTIFAKAIKQNPLSYMKLNNAYMRMTDLSRDGKLLHIIDGYRGQMYFEPGNNPFLTLLI